MLDKSVQELESVAGLWVGATAQQKQDAFVV